MKYLVLNLVTHNISRELGLELENNGYEIEETNLDDINEGETNTYTLESNTTQNLNFMLNWGGSELNLSVYMPNGTLYESNSSQNPPILSVSHSA